MFPCTRPSILPPPARYDEARAITSNRKGEKMLLIVGSDKALNGQRTIETSNPHIARLSPRWTEAFMRGTQRRSTTVVKIRFPEDEAEAMSIVVSAAHDNLEALPSRLSLEELIQLALVAERYDLNHVLIGHIGPWLAPHRQRILQCGYGQGYEQWLYVAWQFGLKKDYLKLADYFAVHCAVNAQEQLLIPNSDRPIAGHLPDNALYAIGQNRLHVIWALFVVAYGLAQEMLDSSTCRLTSASQAEQELCTARSFHGFYRYLQHHGLYPRPETAKSVRESVHHIRQILMSPDVAQYLRGCVITFTGSSIPASAQQLLLDRHSKTCRIEEELSRRLRAVFKTVPHAAEAELVRQMRRNAERMGHEWRRQNAATPPPAPAEVKTEARTEVRPEIRSEVDVEEEE